MTSYFKIKRSKHKPIIIMCKSFHILCSNVTGFLKNVFKRQSKAHLKKENWRPNILRWIGREIVQNVARTRKWSGSHSTPRSPICSSTTPPWRSILSTRPGRRNIENLQYIYTENDDWWTKFKGLYICNLYLIYHYLFIYLFIYLLIFCILMFFIWIKMNRQQLSKHLMLIFRKYFDYQISMIHIKVESES